MSKPDPFFRPGDVVRSRGAYGPYPDMMVIRIGLYRPLDLVHCRACHFDGERVFDSTALEYSPLHHVEAVA